MGIRLAWAAVIISGLTAFAERPPPVGKAPTEFYATPTEGEGPTPGARFLATLPYEARDELRKKGRVVLELQRKRGYVHAVIRLERPIDEAYALITQPSNQQRYLPHVAQSKTVSGRTQEGESVDYVVSVLFATFNFRVQHWFYPEQQRIEWTLDPSGKADLAQQTGYLQLYALDPKTTIAEFSASVVVRDKFVTFLRNLRAKGEVSDALTALRKYIATAQVPTTSSGRSRRPRRRPSPARTSTATEAARRWPRRHDAAEAKACAVELTPSRSAVSC